MSIYTIGNEIASGVEVRNSPVRVDLAKLIVSRLLIQASSGSGKSYLMRRLLEQTFGHVQQIVIDVEGEFASLREKYDYVLGAKEGGETSVDPRAASLLATRLLELRASAILDIYELNEHQRLAFVKAFLDSLLNAPRKLWHPVIVAIDEAHKFCPQSHEVESSEAIMALCSRGRKRGFCAVLATQRLSKLHKDAAAECLNKVIGRTQLDLDVRRASDDLGFVNKQQRHQLRLLHPGEFFAFGPAIKLGATPVTSIVRMKGAAVSTTHPQAGGRIQKFKPPPPTQRIKKLLPSLADLPAEVEEKEVTKREMQRTISDLTRRNADLARAVATPQEVKTIEIIKPGTVKKLEGMTAKMVKHASLLTVSAERLQETAHRLNIKPVAPEPDAASIKERVDLDIKRMLASPVHIRILAALKQFPGSDMRKLGDLIQVSPNRSTFRFGIARLKRDGHIHGGREAYFLTPAGEVAAKDMPTAPMRGSAGVAYWTKRVGGGVPGDVFKTILKAGGRGISKDEIERATEIDTNKSTFRLAIMRLKTFDLITGDVNAYYIREGLSL